jgi:hypothetical protein
MIGREEPAHRPDHKVKSAAFGRDGESVSNRLRKENGRRLLIELMNIARAPTGTS